MAPSSPLLLRYEKAGYTAWHAIRPDLDTAPILAVYLNVTERGQMVQLQPRDIECRRIILPSFVCAVACPLLLVNYPKSGSLVRDRGSYRISNVELRFLRADRGRLRSVAS